MFRRCSNLAESVNRLCWEDKLLHNVWKVRYNSNIDLKALCDSVTDPKDQCLLEFGNLFKEMVSDPVDLVLDKALDALIAYLKAADADIAGGYAREICDATVANCLTDRPEAAVSKALTVLMLWVELEAVDAVLDAMKNAIKSQDVKAVVLATDFTIQALREFGSKIVPPNRLLEMLLEIYDHQDQNVRASSKRLTVELCRWIGREPVKTMLFEKMSDTMEKELDAELANVTMAAKPTRKIRSEQMKEPEWKDATYATRAGPSVKSAAKFPLGKDESELVDPVDILTPLEKSGFWKKVNSRIWSQRKEAADILTKLASTKRIAPGEYTELCRTLEKLATDLIVAVRVGAVRAIGNLALGLRINFSSYSRILLPVLLSKLTEKDPDMEEALTNTLQTIHKAGCVTISNILFYVTQAVKSEDPRVRSRTLNWVMHCITSCNKVNVLNMYMRYLRICLECLDDETADVRDAAFSVMVAIGKSIGMKILNMSLEKLDYVRRKRLAERSEIKENESRLEYLFREYSITQLKNAAWEELLEETNQLQKMSLSDSQEQSKKQKQHTDIESLSQEQNKKRKLHHSNEKGFLHFVKAGPGLDVLADDEDYLDSWIEEVQLIKSLACKRCQMINCICRPQLRINKHEMASSSMFSTLK